MIFNIDMIFKLQSQARTHAVLVVIVLYEVLGHPTT
jgi:hypothetical protein